MDIGHNVPSVYEGDAPSACAPQANRQTDEFERHLAELQRLWQTSGLSSRPDVKAKAFLKIIFNIRKLRQKHLPKGVFSDPLWDILLHLKWSEFENRKVSVSVACSASGVPPTTGLRSIGIMVKRGMLIRTPDRFDGRRVHLSLSPDTSRSLDDLLGAALTVFQS